MYTIKLYDIINKYGYSIFPEYEFNNINYYDSEITKEKFETMFIEYYENYEIAYETVEEFLFEFKRIFNRNFKKFYKSLEMQNQIVYDLKSYKHNYSINDKTDNIFSDTPNEPMDGAENNYYTNRTKYTADKVIEDSMNMNDIERFNDIYEKIHDVIYNFFDMFSTLFLSYIAIKNLEV